MWIYEEIREKGYPGSYTTVKSLCRKLRKVWRIQAVYRYETEPGKQSQVDFGEFGYIEHDGKSRKNEHFEGLLKAIRDENSAIYEQMVETRDLRKYEDVA